MHSYFDQWNSTLEGSMDPIWLNNTLTWIGEHAAAARCAGKPVVLGEYGSTNSTMQMMDYPKIHNMVEQSSVAGDLVWHFVGPGHATSGYDIGANNTGKSCLPNLS